MIMAVSGLATVCRAAQAARTIACRMLYEYSTIRGLSNPFLRRAGEERQRGNSHLCRTFKKEVWVSGPEGGINHESQFAASGVSTT